MLDWASCETCHLRHGVGSVRIKRSAKSEPYVGFAGKRNDPRCGAGGDMQALEKDLWGPHGIQAAFYSGEWSRANGDVVGGTDCRCTAN